MADGAPVSRATLESSPPGREAGGSTPPSAAIVTFSPPWDATARIDGYGGVRAHVLALRSSAALTELLVVASMHEPRWVPATDVRPDDRQLVATFSPPPVALWENWHSDGDPQIEVRVVALRETFGLREYLVQNVRQGHAPFWTRAERVTFWGPK